MSGFRTQVTAAGKALAGLLGGCHRLHHLLDGQLALRGAVVPACTFLIAIFRIRALAEHYEELTVVASYEQCPDMSIKPDTTEIAQPNWEPWAYCC